MHNVSPQQLRHLAHQFQLATQRQDWEALMRCDQQLQKLLSQQGLLNDPHLASEITKIKAIHQTALNTLTRATCELEKTMNDVRIQQERAIAYQLVSPDGELR